MDHSRRTVIKAGAWTVPVITVAALAPAAAASTASALSLTVTFSFQSGIQSYYKLPVTNLGSGAIPAGDLQCTIVLESGTDWGGWSDDGSWSGPTIAGNSLLFINTVPLGAGAETGYFLVILNNLKGPGGGLSYATATMSAPGYTPSGGSLTVYGT